MKTLILATLLLTSPIPFQSDIKTEYDRFRDETTISTGRRSIDTKSTLILKVEAYCIHKGQTKASPEVMGLTFYSTSSHWKFLRNNTLNAVVDGERIQFGEAAAKDSRLARYSGVNEVLDYELTPEQLRKLANATSIEMQLGSVEFQLKDKFIQALKDLNNSIPK